MRQGGMKLALCGSMTSSLKLLAGVVLVVMGPACDSRALGPASDVREVAVADLANVAGPDLANACEAAQGYCDPGDAVKSTCKTGFREDPQIVQSHPGICGLGICCVPIPPDCRTAGCANGTHCDACLGASGVEYVCIGDNAAC